MKSCQPSWVKQKILECKWPFCVRIFCLRKKQNHKKGNLRIWENDKRKSLTLQTILQPREYIYCPAFYHNTIYLKIRLHEMMCDIAPWEQMCGCCIYNETKQEHNINMTCCVYKTIDNDVEQTLEYGWACLHPHGDLSESHHVGRGREHVQ